MTPLPEPTMSRLTTWNLAAGLLHLAQGVAMLVLATAVSLPVTAVFATGPPGQSLSPPEIDELFSYPLGPAVAVFSLLSAFFHLLVWSPWGRARYERELAREQNRFRWVEYSLSASLMIVLIAGISGITDVVALLALFGVNASMILFGWLMETTSRRGPEADWTPFVFGCLAGIVPWVGIAVYILGAGSDVPDFVYVIFLTIFVLFNSFAVNQWLQYRRAGRWADYLHGERAYIVLSFVAKSALAWQIFGNVFIE